MKKLLLALVFASSLSGTTYYTLDNKRMASSDEIFNDPFLALRTKTGCRDRAYSIDEAWENLENFNCPEWQEAAESDEQETEATSRFSVHVVNDAPLFNHTCPMFRVATDAACPEKLYWQISNCLDFKWVPSNLDEIQPFGHKVRLSLLDQTFLNPGEVYYFRAKALTETGWTEWSAPFAFQVLKPQQPEDVCCEAVDGGYRISWKGDAASYLVFGGDMAAFIPSIYDARTENLLSETDKNEIIVDSRYAYYRIVGKEGESFSVPSELVVTEDFSALIEELEPGFALPVAGYSYNPHVSREVWDKLAPHFLPSGHPAKHALDKIFKGKKRVLQDIDSLKKAGFRHPKPRQWTRLIVTSHKKVPGMIIKLYTDHQRPHRKQPEWYFWAKRIEGVRRIRKYIEEHQLGHLFTTPNKWIYPVPHESSPEKKTYRKNFILVEDDMNILDDKANEARWGSPAVTAGMLNELFPLMESLGLWDCPKPANIPFCKDGKVAFIDTQSYKKWPVKHFRLTPFLSPPMQAHWNGLIKSVTP